MGSARTGNKENTPGRQGDGGGQENGGPQKPRGSGLPFRDRTNTSQQQQQSVSQSGRQERRVVGKGNSLSELAPPLNAARLRPIRQSTRTAIVSLM